MFTFVITGRLSVPRYDLEHQAVEAGHKVSKGVTYQTDFLVAGEGPWGNKHKKAKVLGIPVIDEDEFKNILNQ